MKDDFLKNLKRILGEELNISVTENGAVGYRTTGKELLDLNFAVSSLRNAKAEQIAALFTKAYYEDKLLAVKWLFFAGDVRGGMGERRLFRECMRLLVALEPDAAKKVLAFIPEYTRWDNYLALLDTPLQDEVCKIIDKQLKDDMQAMREGKPVSLCAKWMPSPNASSKGTQKAAKLLIRKLGVTERQYRKTLSALREYLSVVEVKMSAKQWEDIDYAAVPSRANLLYSDAFLRNDERRRTEYLEKLEKGETKINAGVLFPHDIVHKYTSDKFGIGLKAEDTTLEEAWKALPDFVEGNGSTICVVDGSGSMTALIGGTSVSALSVANALGIYFAERCSGQFKDKFITFSSRPQLVDLSNCKTLHDKIAVALSHFEIANTNIQAVFELILMTAVEGKMKQSDMPKNILILSDMEFDCCTMLTVGEGVYSAGGKKLFAAIAKLYEEYGYKLPRLVFWNIMSRTGTIPVKENSLGVALVSGFSPAVVKMVLSGTLDPYVCLLEQINGERYAPIEAALKAE